MNDIIIVVYMRVSESMGLLFLVPAACFLSMQAHIKYSYVLVSYISTYNVMLIAIACAVAETRP